MQDPQVFGATTGRNGRWGKRVFHRAWSGIVDGVSFGFIAWLQARHPLSKDYPFQLDRYIATWEDKDPLEYYGIPEKQASNLLQVIQRQVERGERKIRFRSLIESPFARNNVAVFDFYPCPFGWHAPTMILAHGLMSVSDIGYRIWAERLNRWGWNAIFMHLPYHYERRPKGYLTGELAVGADLIRTAEGVRQAVVDMRVVVRWLVSQGSARIGGWGTSYGGWIVGQTACVEPLLERVILVEPILRIDKAMWESPAGAGLRRELRRVGVTQELTERHLRLACPSYNSPKAKRGFILLVAGEYDRIVPPELLWELHRRWEGSHFYCFPQGHVGYRLMPESFRLATQLWSDDFRRGSS
ncbi:alpha/beta hydrolase [Candidatus Methylacidithermus pantelleriae]|uniref:Alpha/beta hydrolase family protein n=1 Tax=Candidatus Methylacidithermus pantelleriae TaxID=2744239 RepID=A0A8J2BLM9_9BACT|nr:alpha/beta hydrolase [Candidatus Methylacidithermus pantelleriae]CAF0705273.1 conserved hypothetical protein [Candidatus Methylacidithermus pantelleriae]